MIDKLTIILIILITLVDGIYIAIIFWLLRFISPLSMKMIFYKSSFKIMIQIILITYFFLCCLTPSSGGHDFLNKIWIV